MIRVFCLSILVTCFVVNTNVLAEEPGMTVKGRQVPRSFSGGSGAADMIALPAHKESKRPSDEDLSPRAKPKLDSTTLQQNDTQEDEIKASQPKVVRRSMSGGSGMSDTIRLK